MEWICKLEAQVQVHYLGAGMRPVTMLFGMEINMKFASRKIRNLGNLLAAKADFTVFKCIY